jgi:hypothetical protein
MELIDDGVGVGLGVGVEGDLVEVSKLMKEGRVILGKIFGMEIFYYICI